MRALPCLLLLVCLWPHEHSYAWESKTKSVRDGDSINVVNAEKALVNIRLYGIDAPESRQAYGPQAKKRLKALVDGKAVRIEVLDTDQYGRNVALVRTRDGELVNLEMVRAGLAWVYEQYCTREEICDPLRQAQAEARSARRGLWSETYRTPPWEWRRTHKAEEWYDKPLRGLKSIVRKIAVALP